MRWIVVLLLVVVLASLGLVAEPFAPVASLDGAPAVIGRDTVVHASAHDRGTGLARLELRLVPQNATSGFVLASAEFPRRSFRGSGVGEAAIEGTAKDAGALAEGPATLEVWVKDHSWLPRFTHAPAATQPVIVDLTPPTIGVISEERIAKLGGSETVVYRIAADATESGVQVGREFFPGVAGLFADANLRVAVFALAQDAPDARPVVVATDAAGNRAQASVGIVVKPRVFAEKRLELNQDFLARKVPELLHANGMPDGGGDLVAGYLRINRELRARTEARVREICKESAPRQLWQGGFLRMPNSAPLSGFADRRSYVYQGQVIDNQTHLGFDLASLRGSPVPAANAGRVVFAGPLGIYGDTVIIDHGLGVFTLYGHLSEVGVTVGTDVARGAPVGKTGETGLAGGDHLHFSVMVHGVHVDPVEWWDGHWIEDHVIRRVAGQAKAAGAPS
jgi:murein DD-endopeptidase MepM/ murein hydrolase activator NlpD